MGASTSKEADARGTGSRHFWQALLADLEQVEREEALLQQSLLTIQAALDSLGHRKRSLQGMLKTAGSTFSQREQVGTLQRARTEPA